MEVGVAVNARYAPFYDLIQTALSSLHKVTIEQFLPRSGRLSGDCADRGGDQCARTTSLSVTMFPLAYGDERILHGELATTASYRRGRAAVQEDTMRFASTLENMGVSFINAIADVDRLPAGAGNALRTCAGAAD